MVSKISEVTHSKMSKKIEKLTKVILHLNSKVEKNEIALAASNNLHEKEIEQLLITANEVIDQQNDALKIAQEENNYWKEKISQIEAAHLGEKNEFVDAFESYKE